MEFLLCQTCEKTYPIHKELESLIGQLQDEFVEFTEEIGQQREFCRTHHACEILTVISDVILGSEEDIYRRTLVFRVIKSIGVPAIIIKTRKRLDKAPVYKYYPSLNEVPPEIGRLINITV